MALRLGVGDVEIDAAVEVQQARVLAGHQETRQDADGDGAVATDDERDLARPGDRHDTIRDRSCHLDHERHVLRPAVFRVRARHHSRQVAVVDEGASGGFESLHEARVSERRRRLLLAWSVRAGTRRHAEQTEDGQGSTLWFRWKTLSGPRLA